MDDAHWAELAKKTGLKALHKLVGNYKGE